MDSRSARRSAVELHYPRHHRPKEREESAKSTRVSAKENQLGSEGKGDPKIICQRAGMSPGQSRAPGRALVREVPPVEETPRRA